MKNKCIAEFLGTFALCFVGILAIQGSGIAGAPAGTANLASIGLAHGLTIAVMISAFGAVSGAHFNPAVTFGFVVSRRMDVRTGAAYWLSQLAGGLAAGLLLTALFNKGVVAGGTPDLAKAVSTPAAIVLEAVATFFLVTVIFGSAVREDSAGKSIFPLAIGLTVALDIMAIGPLTGAAMNPARVFGPALASGHWAHHLVFWVGPLAGGALGALVYDWVVAARAEAVAEVVMLVEEPVAAAA
jgi:MIP family channel proteins